jgi:hypothetical protein
MLVKLPPDLALFQIHADILPSVSYPVLLPLSQYQPLCIESIVFPELYSVDLKQLAYI